MAIGLLALWPIATLAGEPLVVREIAPRQVASGFAVDGVVEAVNQATVAAQVSGRLLELRVDAGSRVKKGELLARIDTREAGETAAAAKARQVDARAAWERARQLQQQKFISAAAVDRARAEYDAAQAGAAAAGVAQSHGTIVAPFAGIVAERHAEAGEMATPGKPLLTLYEPSALRVVASVPQYKLAELRRAALAMIEFPEAGKRFESREIVLLPTADARSHTVGVRVKLPGEATFAVPGMAARLSFATGEASRLTVPRAAVLRRGEVTSVYVQSAGGGLGLRQLRLGDSVADGEIEVLAGLAAGERIALDPVKAAIVLKAGQAAR
jgi:RND family efflux transporter MFP subunit